VELGLGFGRDDACTDGEVFTGNTHLRFRMGLQIPDPLRSWVFGDQVEASVTMGEPDFDFAGQTTAPASSGEIEILLAVEAIGL